MLTLHVLTPYWIFSAMLQSNNTGSWDTMPIWDLRKGTLTLWDGWPSINWKKKKKKDDIVKTDLMAYEEIKLILWLVKLMSKSVDIPLVLHQGRRTFPTVEHWCFFHSRCSQQMPKSVQASRTQTGRSAPGYLAELDRWTCSWWTLFHLWIYPKDGRQGLKHS